MAESKTNKLPLLSGEQARNIDLDVTEKLGRVRVLESVASRIADSIHYHLGIEPTTSLLFVSGKGNNGANAVAAARILHLRGFTVKLVPLVSPSEPDLRPNISEQFALFSDFVGSDSWFPLQYDVIENHTGVIIDGVLGTGITNPPRGVSKEAIEAMNMSTSPILSIDMPSGLNHVTGEVPGECVKAKWTLSLHTLKSGQLEPSAKSYIGELWAAESALGFITFPEPEKFQQFYKDGPIRKVPDI
jgi:hydroxyethylthiazole kinase-like uncharacterized protein yjeF